MVRCLILFEFLGFILTIRLLASSARPICSLLLPLLLNLNILIETTRPDLIDPPARFIRAINLLAPASAQPKRHD